jgi:hypothetical protein
VFLPVAAGLTSWPGVEAVLIRRQVKLAGLAGAVSSAGPRTRRAIGRARPRRGRRLVDGGGRSRPSGEAGIDGAVVIMEAGQPVTACRAVAVLSVAGACRFKQI